MSYDPPGSGTPGYQDMQVAWTPTNLIASQVFGYSRCNWAGIETLTIKSAQIQDINVGQAPDLISISFPNLTNVTYNGELILTVCPKLVSIDAPLLQTTLDIIGLSQNPLLSVINLPSLVSTGFGFDVSFNNSLPTLLLPNFVNANGNLTANACPLLTTVNLSSFVPNNLEQINFSGDALDQASVDLILHRAVLSAGYVNGAINLGGGTNSAPSSVAPGSDYDTLVNRGVIVTVNP